MISLKAHDRDITAHKIIQKNPKGKPRPRNCQAKKLFSLNIASGGGETRSRGELLVKAVSKRWQIKKSSSFLPALQLGRAGRLEESGLDHPIIESDSPGDDARAALVLIHFFLPTPFFLTHHNLPN